MRRRRATHDLLKGALIVKAKTSDQEPAFALLATALAVLLASQVIRSYLTSAVSLPAQVFTSPLLEFNLVYSENRGMNFGLFAADTVQTRWTMIGIALAVSTVLAIVFLRKGRASYAVAGGMILGGAASNVFERLWFGFVFDYINTPILGLDNPFNYNVADIFIVLPIIWWVFHKG